MAYRDKALGPNGILELTNTERQLGEQFSTPIEIGIETMTSSEGDFISFAGKGEKSMMKELQIMSSCRLTQRPSSFAIHHFESWLHLKP
ncbi:hypothetical protein FZC66_16305 [Priestia megaterium]|nr:hypothetical protein FZC66_16305 [Priestia megaterium]